MSNYDALASFILLCMPLIAVVQLLNWWLCPVEDQGPTANKAARPPHRVDG